MVITFSCSNGFVVHDHNKATKYTSCLLFGTKPFDKVWHQCNMVRFEDWNPSRNLQEKDFLTFVFLGGNEVKSWGLIWYEFNNDNYFYSPNQKLLRLCRAPQSNMICWAWPGTLPQWAQGTIYSYLDTQHV